MTSKDDQRAVLEWMAENPIRWEPRGWFAQTLIDAMTLLVWSLLGGVAVMVMGAPFMFLWFLVFFD
jgi:hypothetical protein